MRRFNPERELKRIQHGNRNKIILFVISLLVVGVMGYSFALYQVRYSKRIIYTKVAPFSTKDIQLAVKVEGEEGSLDYFPKKDESYEYVKTECDIPDVTTVEWKEADWKLNLLTSGPNKCTVTFRQIKYKVTTEVVGSGTVDPQEQEVVKGKNSEKFTITPNDGYGVESVSCDNNQQVTRDGNIFTVTNVTNNTKCTINLAREYTITAKVTANGTVQPDSQKVIVNKDSADFTIIPNPGYVVSAISCTNNQEVSRTSNTFKVTNVTNDSECTILLSSLPPIPFSDIIKVNNSTILADGTTQNNIRYVGKSPSNYIWFNCNDYNGTMDESNCEKWRIIGLFKNINKAEGGTEDLVKIIRADSIGDIAWDSSNSNNWTKPASLQTKLNDTYYNGTAVSNSKKGITSATKGMIEQVTWNIGGPTVYDNVTTSQFYTAERGSTKPSAAETTWPGYIGLMYPSDYGYATSGGGSHDRSTCLAYKLYSWDGSEYKEDCAGNDWLLDTSKTQWTLTPNSSGSSSVLAVRNTGFVGGSYNGASDADAVRPSLYLKSSVKVKSGAGNGSSEHPYIPVP